MAEHACQVAVVPAARFRISRMKPLPDSSRAKGKRPFSYQLRLPGAMDLPVSRLVLLVHHAQAPVQLITPSSTCLVYVPFEHPPILRFISSFIRKSLYSVLYPVDWTFEQVIQSAISIRNCDNVVGYKEDKSGS